MILSLEGEEANGKTTMLYTGPGPIVGFAFDMGWQRALMGGQAKLFEGMKIEAVPYSGSVNAVWKSSGADITIFELPQPIQLDNVRVKGARELWDNFLILMVEALQDPNLGSVVVDTMTVARRIKADAYLQTLQEKWIAEHPNVPAGTYYDPRNPQDKMRERLIQIEYGPVNDAIRDIYTTCQGLHRNLAVSHHLTDERVSREIRQPDGSVRTEQVISGRRILEGLAQTHRYVDIAMLMEKSRDSQGKMGIKGTFRKCGFNLDLEGTSLMNPTWNSVAGYIELSIGGQVELPKRV